MQMIGQRYTELKSYTRAAANPTRRYPVERFSTHSRYTWRQLTDELYE